MGWEVRLSNVRDGWKAARQLFLASHPGKLPFVCGVVLWAESGLAALRTERKAVGRHWSAPKLAFDPIADFSEAS